MPNGTDFQAAIHSRLVACPELLEISVIILFSSLLQSVCSKPKSQDAYWKKKKGTRLILEVRYLACKNIFHYYNKKCIWRSVVLIEHVL